MKLHPIARVLLLGVFVVFTVTGAEEPGRLEGVVGTADGQRPIAQQRPADCRRHHLDEHRGPLFGGLHARLRCGD